LRSLTSGQNVKWPDYVSCYLLPLECTAHDRVRAHVKK
jgi:hypothetical protein